MKKKTKQIAGLKWSNFIVAVTDIQPTPGNYKIKTKLGQERLKASLKSFGLAGTVVCNWAGKVGDIKKIMLIDGNSRREEAIEAGEKFINASLPNRPLNAIEYKEMSAMFDFAKAGEVDMDRIESELGGTADFYEKYHLEVPMDKLQSLGNNNKNGVAKKGTVEAVAVVEVDEYPVSLFFNKAQEALFRKCEDVLKKKFKTISTSDTVLQALKAITKIKK